MRYSGTRVAAVAVVVAVVVAATAAVVVAATAAVVVAATAAVVVAAVVQRKATMPRLVMGILH
jgi:hypothetical protein